MANIFQVKRLILRLFFLQGKLSIATQAAHENDFNFFFKKRLMVILIFDILFLFPPNLILTISYCKCCSYSINIYTFFISIWLWFRLWTRFNLGTSQAHQSGEVCSLFLEKSPFLRIAMAKYKNKNMKIWTTLLCSLPKFFLV